MTGPHRPGDWDSVYGGRPAQKKDQTLAGAGKMGMAIFLTSLSVLFLSSLVGYWIVRSRAATWGPEGGGSYPKGLWLSTLVIWGTSLTIDRGLRWLRKGDRARSLRFLRVTFWLGVAFLVLQLINWFQLQASGTTPRTGLYGFTFYLFTGLHAAHVIGGLIPLWIVLRRMTGGAYDAIHHGPVLHSAMYWHFLDAVWVVLFVVILIG
jgi:cytochrome c oxidase subunit 3